MSTIRVFKHYIKVPLLLLAILDFGILVTSVYLAADIRMPNMEYDGLDELLSYGTRAQIYAITMIFGMLAVGLYQTRIREGIIGILLRLIIAYSIGTMALALLFYLVPDAFLGRGILIISTILSLTVILFMRYAIFKFDSNIFKRRILVLGAGKNANALTSLRRKTDQFGFIILGYVHVRGTAHAIDPSKIIKLKMPLKDFSIINEVDEIVLAIDDRRKGLPVQDLLDCKMSGIKIIDLASFFEREAGKIRLDQIQPSWLMLSDGFNKNSLHDIGKRLFDITSSILLLMLTWPFMIFTIITIKIEDGFKAPVMYRQIRIGESGRPFPVLKFRSMRIDAETDGKAKWAQQHDSRITRTGNFIRKVRFDELPQIFNVLRGDMSFVGPRPERPEFVVALNEKIPYYNERHRVKPGITGWAQICYPYGASEEDSLEKLQYDLYYVKNQSLFLDFLILVQTAEVVIFGKGAR